jgi:hypothetical protein
MSILPRHGSAKHVDLVTMFKSMYLRNKLEAFRYAMPEGKVADKPLFYPLFTVC